MTLHNCTECPFITESAQAIGRHLWLAHKIPPPHGTYARYRHRHEPCDCKACYRANREYSNKSTQMRRQRLRERDLQVPQRQRPATKMKFLHKAACRGADRNLFWTEDPSPEARAICGSCPVRQECLEWAIINDEYFTWGGMSREERDQYADKHRVSA